MTPVPSGIYEHYKQLPYRVETILLTTQTGRTAENDWQHIADARHSETLDSYPVYRDRAGFVYLGGLPLSEEHVLYRQRYGEQGWWIRPAAMFVEHLQAGAYEGPRFRYLGPEDPATGDVAEPSVIHDAVGAWQADSTIHPLTCGKNSRHRLLFATEENGAPVLCCPDCDYVQRWVPEIVLKWFRTNAVE